jgi:carbamoyltransferase
MLSKDVYVVGFYKGHNATACILKNGEIIAAASEERFNRQKNSDTFPTQAINYCLKEAGIKATEVDLFVRTYKHPEGYVTDNGDTKMPGLIDFITLPKEVIKKMSYFYPKLDNVIRTPYQYISINILVPFYQKQFRNNMANFLKIDPARITFADHHTCHGYAPYYGFIPESNQSKKDYLVITLDGEGDGACGSVSIVRKGKWKRIATTFGGNSIAIFYGLITKFLGMKINEHEYKVMGLAPYATDHEINKVYPLFKGLFWTDKNLVMHSKIPSGAYLNFFNSKLKHQRFDAIAGAAQRYVEEVVLDLIKRSIKKTGIKNVVLGGGFFMNVKANQRINELSEVKELIVCPSAADESVVFGAAYIGYKQLLGQSAECKNIKNLYLGTRYKDKEIEQAIKQDKNFRKYKVQKNSDIEKRVAELLANGKIVARFKGRMEWGARALGNRSILMDPSRKDLIVLLNKQIKSRDFWMPFAASILKDDESKYIVNSKKTDNRFMAISFAVTDKAKKDLAGAIHPSDFTCRPQVVSSDENEDYYNLISYFKKRTGISAVLNTSFNFHGEPIVCSPKDALNTFSLTALEYLAIGNYLLWKK